MLQIVLKTMQLIVIVHLAISNKDKSGLPCAYWRLLIALFRLGWFEISLLAFIIINFKLIDWLSHFCQLLLDNFYSLEHNHYFVLHISLFKVIKHLFILLQLGFLNSFILLWGHCFLSTSCHYCVFTLVALHPQFLTPCWWSFAVRNSLINFIFKSMH